MLLLSRLVQLSDLAASWLICPVEVSGDSLLYGSLSATFGQHLWVTRNLIAPLIVEYDLWWMRMFLRCGCNILDYSFASAPAKVRPHSITLKNLFAMMSSLDILKQLYLTQTLFGLARHCC